MEKEPNRGQTSMVRLAISIEGSTEERFIKMVLAPHLQKRRIHVTPISLDGGITIGRIRKELNPLASSFDVVTTLYDFYGFQGKSADENKVSLEEKIKNSVSNKLQGKVIPYIQMYEFEGLLFASPRAIEDNIEQIGLADWAKEILRQFGNDPERINDSPQTAPSKRLLSRTDYIKTVHGPNIAKDIGLDTLREKCTGFGEWLSRLETLHHTRTGDI